MIEYPQTILMHNHIEGAEELDSKKVFFLNNLVPTIEPQNILHKHRQKPK